MSDRNIRNILYLSIFLGALLSIASLFFDEGKHFIGVLSGAVIGSLNFYFLVLLMQRMMGGSSGKRGLALRFFMKYGLIAAVIGLVVFVFKVSLLGFVFGFSSVVVSIMAVGFAGMGKNNDLT